jgi:chromosome segregation ATPase
MDKWQTLQADDIKERDRQIDILRKKLKASDSTKLQKDLEEMTRKYEEKSAELNALEDKFKLKYKDVQEDSNCNEDRSLQITVMIAQIATLGQENYKLQNQLKQLQKELEEKENLITNNNRKLLSYTFY